MESLGKVHFFLCVSCWNCLELLSSFRGESIDFQHCFPFFSNFLLLPLFLKINLPIYWIGAFCQGQTLPRLQLGRLTVNGLSLGLLGLLFLQGLVLLSESSRHRNLDSQDILWHLNIGWYIFLRPRGSQIKHHWSPLLSRASRALLWVYIHPTFFLGGAFYSSSLRTQSLAVPKVSGSLLANRIWDLFACSVTGFAGDPFAITYGLLADFLCSSGEEVTTVSHWIS